MKKLGLLIILFFSLTAYSFAGDGDKFFNITGGVMYRNTANAVIGMEFETKYHHAWEIYADLTTIFSNENFWNYKTIAAGAAYKPAFYRWKNANLRARFGADIGTDEGHSFYASIDVGLEFSYSFRNRMQLVIMQKNDFAFWTRENFKNGFLIGLKIPIN
jgi:hypothetical protein